jgi:hypothetical protein
MADTVQHFDIFELHVQNSRRTGVIVCEGIDIKIKKNKTRITAGHTTKAIGTLRGNEEIDFNLLNAKDQPIIDELIKDDDAGILTTFTGIGKLGDTGTPAAVMRLDGAWFTEYDPKYESKKEVALTVNGGALLFTKIKTQFPTLTT